MDLLLAYKDEEPKGVVATEPLSASKTTFAKPLATNKSKKRKKLPVSLPKPDLAPTSKSEPCLSQQKSNILEEPPTKKQKISDSVSLLPPQLRYRKGNVSTEDVGKYFSAQHLKDKQKLPKSKEVVTKETTKEESDERKK